MFEDKDEYIKARAESKAKITKVIKVWNAEEETIQAMEVFAGTGEKKIVSRRSQAN